MSNPPKKEEHSKKKIGRVEGLFLLSLDFSKKCTEDHIGAFGAMAAFFILLSAFPFLIILLTLTKMLPFSKSNILQILSQAFSFEPYYLISSIVNEIYRKTGTSILTFSVLAALWSSSKGIYAIVRGLNSVYDIEDERNYFLIRILSTLYTMILLIIVALMMVLWVFGNNLYDLICKHYPLFEQIARYIIYKRLIVTSVLLTVFFMCVYRFIPNRKSHFIKQLPGALLATTGWLLISWGCSFYMEHFYNFTIIYGSMASIMIILIWLYFCMGMIFYGAEFNYFLENKRNYHMLVRTVQPALRALKVRKVDKLRHLEKEEIRKKKEQREFYLMISRLNHKKKVEEKEKEREEKKKEQAAKQQVAKEQEIKEQAAKQQELQKQETKDQDKDCKDD